MEEMFVETLRMMTGVYWAIVLIKSTIFLFYELYMALTTSLNQTAFQFPVLKSAAQL